MDRSGLPAPAQTELYGQPWFRWAGGDGQPEAALVTQRFTQAEVDDLLNGPLAGGKHLYTVAWPPC